MSDYHTPVLLRESVEMLGIDPGGIYVDVTFGGGGHSRAILEKLGRNGRLIAFDQDADAAANAPDDKRFTLIASNFKFMRGWLRAAGITRVDGILADLGVSSHHFDTPERGFSFRWDAPLDMRMNRQAKTTAADVVNDYDVDRLAVVLGRYGELDKPYRIAAAIEKRRGHEGITTIGELLSTLEPYTPKAGESKFRAKLFQALRIEVNAEMEALEMMLEQSLRVLGPGGRLAVITYHSLEDRTVKNFLRSGNFEGKIEKDFYGRQLSPFELVTRKAVVPSAGEVAANPRARSAKLRCGELWGTDGEGKTKE